jgi:hypothetical protein
MSDHRDFRPFAYLVVTAGVILAFATAVVPHYTAGHVLLFDVLLIGLLPYVVYGAFVTIVRGWPLPIAGALVLGIDAAVKIPERFLRDEVLATNAVYYAPLVSTFIVLPVVLGLGALVAKRRGAPMTAEPGEAHTDSPSQEEQK